MLSSYPNVVKILVTSDKMLIIKIVRLKYLAFPGRSFVEFEASVHESPGDKRCSLQVGASPSLNKSLQTF